jgi:hypothetical protein
MKTQQAKEICKSYVKNSSKFTVKSLIISTTMIECGCSEKDIEEAIREKAALDSISNSIDDNYFFYE